MTPGRSDDEKVIRQSRGPIGYLGPFSSSLTLAWLATHRDRLRSLVVGGKRLTLLVIWDTKGSLTVAHSEAEVEALREIVYGPRRAA